MTEPSLPLGDSFLLSPRTASYMDALIREGDKFDYSKWLERVREGEAQAKQGLRTFISKDLIAPEIGNQTGTSDGIWPNLKLMTRTYRLRERYAGHFPKLKAKLQKLGSCDGLRGLVVPGMIFRPAGLATPCMGIWRPYSQSSNTTKCGERPRSFCDMRLNSAVFRSTRTRTHLLPSFVARVMRPSIVRRSANGRARCGM